MNLVISKPVKCNCYSHVGCVLMIQTVQKLPHVFLSVYLSKDWDFLTMYWYESPLINTESLNMIFFFLYTFLVIFLVSPFLSIITFYYFHDDMMPVAGYLRFPFSAEFFFNSRLLQCQINCGVNVIGLKENR